MQKKIVGTRPARGPVMPMSYRARRSLIRELMPITAPMVPNGPIGMGMK